jgi:hypothetical protein
MEVTNLLVLTPKKKSVKIYSLTILEIYSVFIILNSSVVERSAVNRLVVGSSPTWGEGNFFMKKLQIQYVFYSKKKCLIRDSNPYAESTGS